MTVQGDDIIQNCRECFSAHGYGIRLNKQGNALVCSHDSTHQYTVDNGMLRKLEKNKW